MGGGSYWFGGVVIKEADVHVVRERLGPAVLRTIADHLSHLCPAQGTHKNHSPHHEPAHAHAHARTRTHTHAQQQGCVRDDAAEPELKL